MIINLVVSGEFILFVYIMDTASCLENTALKQLVQCIHNQQDA